MSYESFNIRPGMSTWVDMPESYKNAYHEKFPLAKFGDGSPVQWRSEPGEEIFETPVADEEADWRPEPEEEPEVKPEVKAEAKVEPNLISDEPDWRSTPTVTLSKTVIQEFLICPVCGNELQKGKKYCTRKCFYNRNK